MMKPQYNNILIDAVMHFRRDLSYATTLIPLLKQQYPDARYHIYKPELVDLFKI